MSKFSYQASNQNGQITEGSIDATDKDVVAKLLLDKGLTPIKITSKSSIDVSKFNTINIGKIPIKERVVFLRQLSVLISAGIPIVEAIGISKVQVKNKGLKSILTDVELSIESGKNLADSFSVHHKLFDNIQIQLLRTAETSGSLDYTLDRLATDLENKSNLVSKFRGAMIYPILVIVVAIFVIFLVLTQMIPPMKALYQSFNAKLPAPTQFVITLSTFVIGYWPIILIVLVVVVFGFIFYRRSAQGKKTTDAIFLKIPLFGGLISKIQVVNFGKTFILLIKAGVPLVVGLNLIADSMSNEVFKSGIREIAIDVEKGRPMSTAMSKYSFFPPLLWRMVAIGEETGKMEEVLTKVIEYYESETKDLIENMSKLLEPMITIFLGIIVGFIGVAVYLPIYNLGNVIK